LPPSHVLTCTASTMLPDTPSDFTSVLTEPVPLYVFTPMSARARAHTHTHTHARACVKRMRAHTHTHIHTTMRTVTTLHMFTLANTSGSCSAIFSVRSNANVHVSQRLFTSAGCACCCHVVDGCAAHGGLWCWHVVVHRGAAGRTLGSQHVNPQHTCAAGGYS
jgi:hypothetical protein